VTCANVKMHVGLHVQSLLNSSNLNWKVKENDNYSNNIVIQNFVKKVSRDSRVVSCERTYVGIDGLSEARNVPKNEGPFTGMAPTPTESQSLYR
jgi:hypothetical protein